MNEVWQIKAADKTFICVKNPELFKEDYVFEVPEVLCNGYINCNLKHAKEWYKQVYPIPEGSPL